MRPGQFGGDGQSKSGSADLSRRLERLEQAGDGHVGLFIGATHTHAGPGQFLGTDFYNRFASNRSGFDPAYAEFVFESAAQDQGLREIHFVGAPDARLHLFQRVVISAGLTGRVQADIASGD